MRYHGKAGGRVHPGRTDERGGGLGKNKIRTAAACAGILALALFVAAVFCPAVTSWAAGSNAVATITVLLADEDGNKVLADTEVSLYRIATFDDAEKRTVTAEQGYEALVSELDLSSTEKTCTYESTQTAKAYIEENNLTPVKTVRTGSDGRAEFGAQERGIYLAAFGENDLYEVDAFILEAPLYVDGKWYDDVTASPKISPTDTPDTPDTPTDTTDTPDTPDTPTDTTDTPDTPTDTPDTPTDTPTDTTDTPDMTTDTTEPGDDTVKLPQTGQVKWPIPVLAMGGITLIVLGYTRMGGEKNDEN